MAAARQAPRLLNRSLLSGRGLLDGSLLNSGRGLLLNSSLLNSGRCLLLHSSRSLGGGLRSVLRGLLLGTDG